MMLIRIVLNSGECKYIFSHVCGLFAFFKDLTGYNYCPFFFFFFAFPH